MKPDERIRQSLALIEERLTEALRVDDIAGAVYLSKHHYQRLFTAMVGEPVMEYVKGRRLSLAARELAETDSAVVDIAMKYGYESHEGFTRAFRAFYGVSPTKARRHGLLPSGHAIEMQKEAAQMTASYSETTGNELARTTEAMGAALQRLVEELRALGAMAAEAEQAAGIPGGYHAQLKELLQSLAGAAEAEFKALSREIPAGEGGDFGRLTGKVLRLVKALDDSLFQLHFIHLSFRLNRARCRQEHQRALEPVAARFDDAIAKLGASKQEITGLAMAFLPYVLADVDAQLSRLRAEAEGLLDDGIRQARAVASLTREESGQAGPGGTSYDVIAEETGHIAQKLESIRRELQEQGDMEEWSSVLGDQVVFAEECAFQAGLLALTASLELRRSPDMRGLADATGQYPILAKGLADLADGLAERRQAAAGLLPLSGLVREPPAFGKRAEGLLFQGNVYAFYCKTEFAKLRHVLDEDREKLFARFVGRMSALTGELAALCEEEDRARAELPLLVEEYKALAGEIGREAAALGIQGGVFIVISRELESWAVALERLCQ